MDEMDPATIDLHNNLYSSALQILEPIILANIQRVGTAAPTPSADTISAVNRDCAILEHVVRINRTNWNALWTMGMALKAISQWDRAYAAFKAAFTLEKNNADVAREFCGACIAIGRASEAVEIARHALSLSPNDPGLVANLGMALLANNDVEAAVLEVARALEMDPSDPITAELWSVVQRYQASAR